MLRVEAGRLYSRKFCTGRARRGSHNKKHSPPVPGSLSHVAFMEEEPVMQLTEKHLEYWSKNLRITAILLFIWFVATFVLGYFARDLSFNFFGWPFAFYMAAQGSLIIYVIIIWYYARFMNNLDREYDVHEGEEE
jgi:putative solute:sodium symporter small subunit